MEYKSINNFEVAVSQKGNTTKMLNDSITTIPNNADTSLQGHNMSGTITILISILILIICIISLILNCVKKNTGKAIFSGIGIIVPIISMAISTVSSLFIQGAGRAGIATTINMLLYIFAIILELVFGIISFIFCFSKDKRNK